MCFLLHLSLTEAKVSYQCCCRRPVWKSCGISESETETRKSSHLFSEIRPRSSNTALGLHLYTHLWEEENRMKLTTLLLMPMKPQGNPTPEKQVLTPAGSIGQRGKEWKELQTRYLQLSSSKEQVWESRGKWLKSMLHMAVTVILHNPNTHVGLAMSSAPAPAQSKGDTAYSLGQLPPHAYFTSGKHR
jgi:hypothetical protein